MAAVGYYFLTLDKRTIMAIKLDNEMDRIGYALAMNVISSLSQVPVKFNTAIFSKAITELFEGAEPALSADEYQQTMREFQSKINQNDQATAEAGKENAAEEKKFMDENKKKDGIKVCASGLQYEIITEGSGESPAETDQVRVHYEGTLLDGKVFDSSRRRGEPAEFALNQVIPGWTEALKLMKPGSRHRLFIPSALAYGERGAGNMIPPHSALIFDVELLAII